MSHRAGAGDPRLDTRAALDFLEKDRFHVLVPAVLEQVVEWGHDADADYIVVLRDVPEPARFAFRLDNQRGPFILARVALRRLSNSSTRPPFSERDPIRAIRTGP